MTSTYVHRCPACREPLQPGNTFGAYCTPCSQRRYVDLFDDIAETEELERAAGTPRGELMKRGDD